MTTPFDAIADIYDTLWSATGNGCRQRAQVWKELNGLFRPGSTILDAGCGTGDDAVHFTSLGVRVFAIDSSAAMVDIARSRGLSARRLDLAELAQLAGPFDGALSNFGALNCVRELDPVAREFGRLVRAGRPLAICLMSRFCLAETIESLRERDFAKAVRRWSGRAVWRGIDVYYPSSFAIRRAFCPWFRFRRSVSVGGGDHTLYMFERRGAC